jgi:haloalkane dehalogenase
MTILNTPDHCFENIPDYPFSPNYIEVESGLKLHYVDEGPKDAPVVLMMHGEPSWSFLYRKMIPKFVQAGYRAIAPDLIGFGKSSKPGETSDYTYARHVTWIKTWIEAIDMRQITFFGQDWGGLIGLRQVTAMPERFDRIVVANTGMPTGDQQMPEAFLQWQKFSQTVPVFPVDGILQNATVTELSKEVLAAYAAPFPDESYKAGVRIFPSLVPTQPNDPASEDNRQAWKVLMAWEKPLLTLFSDSDPVTAGGHKVFEKLVPGAKGQPHQIIAGGGHFLQEDKGEEIADIVLRWMNTAS